MLDVFVAPEFRRRGIASALAHRVLREAADLEVAELYLFTTGSMREALYMGLGWSVVDRPVSGSRAGADVDRAEPRAALNHRA